MIWKRLSILLTFSCFLVLVACSNQEQEKKESQENLTPPKEVKEEEREPAFAYPLTGEGSEEARTHRAIAVTINNHVLARPQSGLTKADIVYELLAEGSITRFLAIYQSEFPDRFGPVRSARDYFIDVAKSYDGLYIAHGYSPSAKERLDSGEIDNLNGMKYDGSLFNRSTDRKAPHNSYISYENVLKGANKEQYSMQGAPASLEFLTKSDVEELRGEKINQIKVAYSKGSEFTAEYQFDKETEKYSRYSNGEQTADLDTGEPVLLDNVLIIETVHKVLDSNGRRSIDLTSGGKALLFQKGIMREVDWKSQDGQILPFEDGVPAKLTVGKTWINVVPNMDIVTSVE
ncbi:DUF3048 domain-containing protein [Bacillus niameyensis]|uniref:DUF3048 domain-containing protein n=1 Tax=Bacillus niameyensis TaxID=1522308 RepID=UPI000781356A|nr:DUF3048 domain-containing protein [Bacillus niameyensis]